MRERKRPDWPIKIYKFDIMPIGKELRQLLWDIAKGMQNAWNALVDLRESIRAQITAIPNCSKEQAKEIWSNSNFELKAKTIVSQPEFNLNHECRQEVLDRFHRATTAKKHPKKHFRLDRICIPHYYSGGGRELHKLFTTSSKTLSFRPVELESYLGTTVAHRRQRGSRGYFGLMTADKQLAQLNFKVNLHTKIDEIGFLKRVYLIGNHSCLGWKFHLVLTTEIEPSIIKNILPATECGLDLGWRKLDQDNVRIGYLVDTRGNKQEITLPLGLPSKGLKKHNQYALSKSPNAIPYNLVINHWDLVKQIDQEIAFNVDRCKENLKKSLPKQLPEHIKNVVDSIQLMRQKGLKKLYWLLKEANIAPDSIRELEVWFGIDRCLSRKLQKGKDRLIRFRQWHYRNIALDLARRHSVIYWESDLSIKALAEDPILKQPGNEALKNSMFYRQIVALGEFRQYLKNACKKTGCILAASKKNHTTDRCTICNAPVATGSSLMLTCDNGHKMDQDLNAARRLLAQCEMLKLVTVS